MNFEKNKNIKAYRMFYCFCVFSVADKLLDLQIYLTSVLKLNSVFSNLFIKIL